MEEAKMQQLVGYPEYHSVCLGFWHAAQTRGVDAMRNLPSEAIRQLHMRNCQSPEGSKDSSLCLTRV